MDQRPIGVFDSGLGGLTAVHSLFSRRRTGGRLMLILHLDYILYYAAPSAARQILVFLPCFLCGILRMSLL